MDEQVEKDLPSKTQLALLRQEMGQVKKLTEGISEQLTQNYVTKEYIKSLENRVAMLEKIVYGGATIVLVAFLGTLIWLAGWGHK